MTSGFEHMIPGFLPDTLRPGRHWRAENDRSEVSRQFLCRRVVVAEENDLLPSLDLGFHLLGDGFHLRMDSRFIAESLNGLEMILDDGHGWFGELLRFALQAFSLHIEMTPAHMEARVVGGLRQLGAIAIVSREARGPCGR